MPTARNLTTVLQVQRASLDATPGGCAYSSFQTWDQHLAKVVEGAKGVLGQLIRLQPDTVQLLGAQGATVEDEQHLVPFGMVRCPVHDQQGTDIEAKPEFLENLALARLPGTFAHLDIATRDVPVVLVRGPDEHDSICVIDEERARGHPSVSVTRVRVDAVHRCGL
jgi:hypothetical protein